MSKPLQIPMIGFANLKAGANLSVSNTLQPLLPISFILVSVVNEVILLSVKCRHRNAIIPRFPDSQKK